MQLVSGVIVGCWGICFGEVTVVVGVLEDVFPPLWIPLWAWYSKSLLTLSLWGASIEL
jgi:hypothetical protein